jgi:hypothetical protein
VSAVDRLGSRPKTLLFSCEYGDDVKKLIKTVPLLLCTTGRIVGASLYLQAAVFVRKYRDYAVRLVADPHEACVYRSTLRRILIIIDQLTESNNRFIIDRHLLKSTGRLCGNHLCNLTKQGCCGAISIYHPAERQAIT